MSEAANIETIREVSAIKIIKLSKPESFYIFLACLASIIVGCSPPIFSTFFGDVIDVSKFVNHGFPHFVYRKRLRNDKK